MIRKIEGIVVREQKYSETSKIIDIITEEGIVGIMAKGSRTMKSELRSVTNKLVYGDFNIYYKKDKLSTLISVDVSNNFKNIKKDITKISYASFLLDLSSQVMKQSDDKLVYQLLVQSLIKIDEGYDPAVISNILELKYLDLLGVMPTLDSCSICGSTSGIETLSNSAGGYVCDSCVTDEAPVSNKTIKLIRMFYYVDISKITKLDVSEKSKVEINEFLDEYYDRYTGLYLRSKSFLKNLSKLN